MDGSSEEVLDLVQWRAITERAPLPMATVQGAKHFLYRANPAFCHLLGRTREELKGRPFGEIMPQPDQCLSLLDRVYNTGQAETHTEKSVEQAIEQHPEPSHPVYASLMMWPIFDITAGIGTRPVGVAIQVTETARFRQQSKQASQTINQPLSPASSLARGRVEPAAETAATGNILNDGAEGAERLSEARFRALANSLPNIVWCVDDRGKTSFVSDKWYRFTGMAQESAMREMGFLDAVHPDDRQRMQDAWLEASKSGNVYELECRLRAADGSYRWHLARAVCQPTDGIQWFGTYTDIDNLKNMQQALLRTEKLASAGRMAASIAHEINNPLEAIINTLYLAHTSDTLPERIQEYLRIAEGELMRIAHIARLSLGFYRESSVPAIISVPALLDSAVDLVQSRIKAKLVTIEKQYRKRLRIKGIAGELRQVFANVLANSLDAVEERGTIKLRAANSSSSTGLPAVRITIADSGHGIAPGVRQHIFEPFFTTKSGTGTGLGLWVTKEIVDKHGGSIRVHSRTMRPRAGTVVSIVLPDELPPAKPPF